MAFLGRCYGCRAGKHEEHTESFDSPPPDSMICGGGICVCRSCNYQMAPLDNYCDECLAYETDLWSHNVGIHGWGKEDN